MLDDNSLQTNMPSIEVFGTTRLMATRVQESDYDELCALHGDPEVMATLGGIRSNAVTREFLLAKLAHWEEHGHGMWMFRDKQSQRFIGRGLLEHIEVGGNTEVEVGYTVVSTDWGRGLATEMAAAIVSLAFHRLDVASIVSFTYPDNFASRRVMEKVGFQYERDIQHVGRPHVLYRLTRSGFSGQPALRVQQGMLVVG